MHNGYNKGVEPPSVPFSHLLYMRYAKVHKGVHKGCTLVQVQCISSLLLLSIGYTGNALGVHRGKSVIRGTKRVRGAI